jgi:mannose-6-phosphate isomerase-like protein (cupin superfamily)
VVEHFENRKDRVFLRAVQGAYNLKDELRRLRARPRVQRAEDVKFIDGPQAFSKHYLHPETGLGQTLHIHLEEYAPGGRSQMHFHVNEAVFYILDGRGYEIHDGVRTDWQAGDVAEDQQRVHGVACVVAVDVAGAGEALCVGGQAGDFAQDVQGVHGGDGLVAVGVALDAVAGGGGAAGEQDGGGDGGGGQEAAGPAGGGDRSPVHHHLW